MKKNTLAPLSILIILFVSLVFIPVSAAPTITVSPGAGDDTPTIDAAIANIDDGGTIFFEAGTYDVNIVIDDPGKSFSLVGAGQGSTFLDGNDADSVIKILNSDPHTITVKGFTIQNGSYGTQNVGGGIHTNNSIICVQDCIITNNTTTNGGGMYIQYSAGEITNCNFIGNLADGGSGGAIYNWGSSPDITGCTFNSNVANSTAFGGAIYNHESSSPTITDCTFVSNITNGSGGAIGNNIDSSPKIVSCTFTENEGEFAGAIGNRYGSESFISDCTFNGNIAGGWGGEEDS